MLEDLWNFKLHVITLICPYLSPHFNSWATLNIFFKKMMTSFSPYVTVDQWSRWMCSSDELWLPSDFVVFLQIWECYECILHSTLIVYLFLQNTRCDGIYFTRILEPWTILRCMSRWPAVCSSWSAFNLSTLLFLLQCICYAI